MQGQYLEKQQSTSRRWQWRLCRSRLRTAGKTSITAAKLQPTTMAAWGMDRKGAKADEAHPQLHAHPAPGALFVKPHLQGEGPQCRDGDQGGHEEGDHVVDGCERNTGARALQTFAQTLLPGQGRGREPWRQSEGEAWELGTQRRDQQRRDRSHAAAHVRRAPCACMHAGLSTRLEHSRRSSHQPLRYKHCFHTQL